MTKEDNLSKEERKEVVKEVNKEINKRIAIADRVKVPIKTFHREFKKQTALAITTAFGLIIALSWKDVINQVVQRINFAQGLLVSALFLTAVGVLGILMINWWAQK